VAQVIGAELELETVPGQGAGRGHHPGVVDQQIQAAVELGQGVGGGDAGQIGQIEAVAIEGPAHCWPRAPRPGDHPGQGSPQRSRGPEGTGAGVIAQE